MRLGSTQGLGVNASWADDSALAFLDLGNVTIALIKGVAIVFCCRTGRIPCNQISFLTRFEPDKVYLSPNRNNKEVAIIILSGRKRPDFNKFPSTCHSSITSCTTWSYPCPRGLLLPPPSVSPNRKTSSRGGGVFINVTVTLGNMGIYYLRALWALD